MKRQRFTEEQIIGILKEGDAVKVKLIEVDEKTGKFKLSRKILMPKPEGMTERPARPTGK